MKELISAPLPATHGGSFRCTRRIVLDIPRRALSSRYDLRSHHGIYFCENFFNQIRPGLRSKPEEKPPKDGEAAVIPTLALLCWETNKPLAYVDLAKRFKGKDNPVPWWGITPLLEWYRRTSDEKPFSLSRSGIIFYIEHHDVAEDQKVTPIRVVEKPGPVCTDYWVDLAQKEFTEKESCPEGTVFLSMEP